MKRFVTLKIWVVVILDVMLVLGIFLAAFAQNSGAWNMTFRTHRTVPLESEEVFTKPNRTEATAPPSGSATTEYFTRPTDTTPSDSDSTADTRGTTASGETSPQDTSPIYDYSGDFGAKFGELFTPVGVPTERGDNYYKSRDLLLTVDDVYTVIDGKNAHYYVIDIYIRNIENLFTAHTNSPKPFLDLVADGENMKGFAPLAALSGDFWMAGDSNKTKIGVRNGAVYFNNAKDYITDDICVLYWDGTLATYTRDTYDWNAIKNGGPYQLWQFGPALLDAAGRPIGDFGKAEIFTADKSGRNPRSSIGYYEPGHYVFIAVDGRNAVTDVADQGLTLVSLAQIFADLGCKTAYNLDGGDSAYLYYDEEVLRQSSANKKLRDIWDIICIGEIR